jgi:hypothetical protein
MDNTRLTTPADHKGMRLTTWNQRQKLREFLKSRMGWQKDPGQDRRRVNGRCDRA